MGEKSSKGASPFPVQKEIVTVKRKSISEYVEKSLTVEINDYGGMLECTKAQY